MIISGGLRIGVSGWRYGPWRGAFYPKGLVQRAELAYASRQLTTIEINGSFYSLQDPASWGRWFDETPDDFVFSVKGPALHHPHEAPARDRCADGQLLRLGRAAARPQARAGAVAVPAELPLRPGDLRAVPGDAAVRHRPGARLAERHDHRVVDRTWLEIDAIRPLRHAVEVRHPSFVDPDFIALLRQYDVAFVAADTTGLWPEKDDVTADFVYVRLHGSQTLYQSAYTDAELDRWAARIAAWRAGRQAADARLIAPAAPPRRGGRDVFCYFDNTDKLQAPIDAKRLIARLGASTPKRNDVNHAAATVVGGRSAAEAWLERAPID
jgi:uncharacterized protein YecE (DUF72 family)